ncbi:hypothetical protein C0J52_20304 [Blattella germanica]|nr:hypothetical protein C0J52_20304 [Blattella germanica]
MGSCLVRLLISLLCLGYADVISANQKMELDGILIRHVRGTQSYYECTTYCMAKRDKYVDANGYLIEEEFKRVVSDYYPEEDVKQVVRQNAHNCTVQFNQYAKDNWEKNKDVFCNPSALEGAFCLMESVELPKRAIKEEIDYSKSGEETSEATQNKLDIIWQKNKFLKLLKSSQMFR